MKKRKQYPTKRMLTLKKLQRLGACPRSIRLFKRIYPSEQVWVSEQAVKKLTDRQATQLWEIAGPTPIVAKGWRRRFWAAQAAHDPFSFLWADHCRQSLVLLARYYVRHPSPVYKEMRS